MTRFPLFLLALSALLQGCAAEPAADTSVGVWRQKLERYVWDEGNGDPAVLRDANWDDRHPGFAVLGDPVPERSTDVLGLLLAHPRIGQQSYFIFLVAVVRKQVIQDIRPVALDIEAGQFLWQEGVADDEQTQRYRQSQATASISTGTQFPSREDSFEVFQEDDRIAITHEQSGVTWHVHIPERALQHLL